MRTKIVTEIALGLLLIGSTCWARTEAESSAGCRADEMDVDSVDTILRQLRQKTAKLGSYQAQLEYRLLQPLLESVSIRKGVLYYAKSGKRSKLRVNFETLKQDDEKEQKYIQHFIFDGVWLTDIDYQAKTIKRYQLVEPNSPVDAFELASKNLPMIGFTKVEDLKKQFDITLIRQGDDKQKGLVRLHLKTKPTSMYRDRYTFIDFWIDRKLQLPARVVAGTTEEDIYEIKLLKPRVNQKIDEKVFKFTIPKGFGEPEIIPLPKRDPRS